MVLSHTSEWMQDLPEELIQVVLSYTDLKQYHVRYRKINEKIQQLLLWKPEYLTLIHQHSMPYYTFQWIDLKNNPYEQELALRIIHEKKLNGGYQLLKKLNEMYSRQYFKQDSFTNLYGKTFTRDEFDKRYQKLITDHFTYMHYFPNTPILPESKCINWRGEAPSAWLNY
jgi:hypothetical protein